MFIPGIGPILELDWWSSNIHILMYEVQIMCLFFIIASNIFFFFYYQR